MFAMFEEQLRSVGWQRSGDRVCGRRKSPGQGQGWERKPDCVGLCKQ